MPIYEYRCANCGTVFARLQPISTPANAMNCPDCDSSKTERILSTFAAGSRASESASFGAPAPCGAGGG